MTTTEVSAHLLKDGLRIAFQLKGQAGKDAIDR
jgi:hypothetical protein